MIYFVINNDNLHIKIGYSTNPLKRIKALQTGNSSNLDIISIVNGNIKLEKTIHKYFLKLNIKNEWFIYHEEIKEFIFFITSIGSLKISLIEEYVKLYFQLNKYNTDTLYKILRLGIHINSFFDSELLESKYLKDDNYVNLSLSKQSIIKEIISNKIPFEILMNEYGYNLHENSI